MALPLKFNPKFYLAPMEGVLDPALREIYSRIGGYDQFTTEFIRVSQHLIPRSVFYKYAPELKSSCPGKTKEGVPVFVQLLGSDPNLMAENAHKAAELRAPGIDLNFGCPAKTVNRHDGGASLLKDPNRIFKIISAVRASLPETQLTAKVRLGFESKEKCLDIALAVESGGADGITIHARTKAEAYRPPAHWQFIAKMKNAIGIPVVANGDIWTIEDFQKCHEITGCDRFALGRPAIAHPDLALQIKHQYALKSYRELLWDRLMSQVLPSFIDLCCLNTSDTFALCRIKQWTKFLGRHYPEAQVLFHNIKRAQSIRELMPWIPVCDITKASI